MTGQAKVAKGTQRSGMDPFRPLLNRFADDPADLNVDTRMQGERHGKDISLLLADNLDKLQRDYLLGGLTNVHSHTQFVGGALNAPTRQTISELNHTQAVHSNVQSGLIGKPQKVHSRLAGAQSMKNSNLDPIIRGNWVDRDHNV